jgi:AAA family ATP:ADP antiporter
VRIGEDGPLRGDLRTRTLHLALGAFVLTAAVTLAKVGRDALYFQHGGLYDLPGAYLGMALLSVPLGLLTIALMRRLGPRRARLVVLSGTAGFFLFYAQVAAPGGGAFMTVLYMCVPLTIGIAFSVYWLLAADLLEGASAADLAHSYGSIGASSISGGLVGGLAARGLAWDWEPRALVLLGAVAATLCLAIVARAQRRFAPPTPTTRLGPAEGRSLGDVLCVLRDRYSLLLLLTGMATAAAGLLVEFRFYVAAATSGNDIRQNATLFATIYLTLNAAALAVQLFIAPRLQGAVGVHGSLLVLPTAVVGGAATLLASASALAPSVLRAVEGGLRSSVHRTSWEQAYLTIDRPHRAQTKLLVDGMAGRLAEGLIALVLLAWLRVVIGGRSLAGQDGAWISYLLLGAAVACVGLTVALGSNAGARTAWRVSRAPAAALPLPDT